MVLRCPNCDRWIATLHLSDGDGTMGFHCKRCNHDCHYRLAGGITVKRTAVKHGQDPPAWAAPLQPQLHDHH